MPKTIPPKKSKDILITQEMLFEVRDELKHDIQSLRSENNAQFNKMDTKFEKVLAEVHRIGLLVEEQNARNKFVLDGYEFLTHRMDRQEQEIAKLQSEVK